MTSQLVAQLQHDHPGLKTQDALAIIKDPAGENGGKLNASIERLASSAAIKDPAYNDDPTGTMTKWRQFYGAGAKSAPATQAPQAKAAPPKFVNGQTYTDKHGNKAKYQDGKWIPVP